MSKHPASLKDIYPENRHIVPGAIVLSSLLLIIGLSLPLIHTQQMIFWKSSYSVWQGVIELWNHNELILATFLFFFSIVFPIVKLGTLTILWFGKLADEKRAIWLHWLGILGKWSMLDVFIVAILIVLVKLGPLAKIEPRVGVYVFTAAIFCSMLTTMYVDRLARKSLLAKN